MDEEAQVRLAIHIAAIFLLLMEKGIVTADDITDAKIRATHMTEQEMARQKEVAQKEFDAKHPGTRQFLNKLFGDSFDL